MAGPTHMPGRARTASMGLLAALALCLSVPNAASADADWRLERVRAERGAPPAGTVWAGASRVDITPEAESVYLGGFMPNRRSRGVRDPIFARCAYVDDGAVPFALVSLDLLGFPYFYVKQIRAKLTRDFASNVIVASTHSHAGPDVFGMWGAGFIVPFASGNDHAYVARVVRAAARCVRTAVDTAVPATAVFGAKDAPADISTNFHEPRRPGISKSKDDEVSVARFVTTDGETVATIVNYACHVEALHHANQWLTADYAGYLVNELENRLGGTAIFTTGAVGGLIVPNIPLDTPNEERWPLARDMGLRLANTARAALEAGIAWKPDPGEMRIETRLMEVEFANWGWDFFHSMGILDIEFDRASEEDKRVRTEVAVVRMGPALWLTVPGEIFPSLGNRYKQRMAEAAPDAQVRFLVGLGNDELGYIMTTEEFADDLHSYEQSMSLSPEIGPALTRTVEGLLDELGSPANVHEGRERDAVPQL